MPVQVNAGKVVLVDGKVGTSSTCCCCADCRGVADGFGFIDIEEINTLDLTYTFTSHADDAGDPEDPPHFCPGYDISTGHTFHFDRIPFIETFSLSSTIFQFKLYLQGIPGGLCTLGFSGNHFYPVGITYKPLGEPADDSEYALILDRPAPEVNYDGDCVSGTIGLCFDPGSVTTSYFKTIDPSVNCNEQSCQPFPNTLFGLCPFEIPWSGSDMTVMLGTYTSEYTCDDLPNGTMTVSLTLVIA